MFRLNPRHRTLVELLRSRATNLTGDLVLELRVACGRQDMDQALDRAGL
jgi:hypothetical protein